nr:LysR family transcriptional regulator [Bacteriovorax sp. HI3]
MEIYELKYFLGVARHENIHKASLELGVSPGSLSKAVIRIENELQIKLFERIGRNIKLTSQGHILKDRASQIVQLELDAKLELSGNEGQVTVRIAGPEVLLSKFGVEFVGEVRSYYPNAHFEFLACSEQEALKRVNERDVHFSLISSDSSNEFKSKTLAESSFVTVASTTHPAAKYQKLHKKIPVEKVLGYEFVSPNNDILGQVGIKQSVDGWRDDKFKRKISFQSSSLKLIEEMVTSGNALAYLPDYLARPYIDSKEWAILNVIGCPYTCTQKIKIITKSPIDIGWIDQIF